MSGIDRVVVDTNVLSFILNRDSRSRLYAPHIDAKQPCISFMTVAELYRWTIERKWGQRRVRELESRIKSYLVLPYDQKVAWE